MLLNRVLIIGGGIGGMALAAALHKLGIEAQVYERASELREVGAGIALWPNARASMAQLGAVERALSSCAPLHKAEIMSHRGAVLLSADLRSEWPGVSAAEFHIVHRVDLLAALTERVSAEAIHTGHNCVDIELTADGVRAHFENGKSASGDILVGADGINSVVRRRLLGEEQKRYSGQSCFRGVAHVVIPDADVLREIQGPGKRCAVCPMSRDRIYFWTANNSPAGMLVPQAKRREYLLSQYKGWPGGIAHVIAATPTESILQNDLYDRVPVSTWSRGYATLLGDAAHPTTPNLGQGANMAIDDALVLAQCLRVASNVGQAFSRYEGIRRARTAMIVWRSWWFGMLCRWQSKMAVRLREELMSRMPRALLRSELRQQIFDRAPLLS